MPSLNVPMSCRFWWISLLLACTLATYAPGSRAQDGKVLPPGAAREMALRIPVTVALVDATPANAGPAVILRRANAEPHDVILLAKDAASEPLLSAAIMALMVARNVEGDTTRVDHVLRVRDTRSAGTLPAAERARSSRSLERLRGAPSVNVPSVGNVPAIVLYLAPRRVQARRSPGTR